MINVTELRPGNYFIDEGNLYQVIDILLNKTAMRKMVAKVKVKNMRTGAITELARNSGYGVEDVHVDKKTMQYLYDTGETLCFMDGKTYEQIELPKSHLENEIPYLTANSEVTIVSYEDEVLGVLLPSKVALTVIECEPGVRGDTVTNGGSKDATLETGLKIRVPLFINQGDKVSVDTTTGKYDGRA
ncbi:MAG TPA: elongation factor P [Candidatus Enteromonas pullicola]|uniref:Elongation factor P n=1 Tax=Candidatus Alloenteromonas pullicola TaxID=2840784 RepID=A0A9D1S3A7_9FIRM|nr:elongation factor P [Candidatus Enteromonas pullicola]